MPPANCQEPVVASSARVRPRLSRVPLRLTVPPLRANVPRAAQVNAPPRFTVEFVALIVPVLLQALPEPSPRLNVASVAVIVAALVQPPSTSSVPPPVARTVPELVNIPEPELLPT